MRILKKTSPHLCEYIKLGKSETEEGRKYLEENQKAIDDEVSENIDMDFYRLINIGSDEDIHIPSN